MAGASALGIAIEPAFKENNILIVTSSREEFLPYAAVMLQSICDNSSEEHNYDIVVLEEGISQTGKEIMSNIINGKPNFTLRFYNVSACLSGLSINGIADYVPKLTCARLLVPELFPDAEKAVWLDADTVVERDVAELYGIDIHGYLLAAVRDIGVAAYASTSGHWVGGHLANVLKLSPEQYFNGGVLLLNCELFRDTFASSYLLMTAARKDFRYMDQDALNYLCRGKVRYLDIKWNYNATRVKCEDLPAELYKLYKESGKNPYIVHYIGPDKPGEKPDLNLAERFWLYASETGYYYKLIFNMINAQRKITLEKYDEKLKKELEWIRNRLEEKIEQKLGR